MKRNGNRTNHTASKRRGLAALELALLLPLLMLIVLGCVDFGRFAHAYIAVTNAARAGAGHGCMHPPTNASLPSWRSAIRDTVVSELEQTLEAADRPDSDVTVSAERIFDSNSSNAFWRAEVTVSMPFETIIAWPALPNSVLLTRTVKMRGIR